MKHLVFKLSVLVLVAMTLVSCEKKDPTALNEENIAGSATVRGYVSYNYSTSVTNFKGGADVYVDVDLSSINSKLTGVKRYVASTDNKGYYEVIIPAKPGSLVSFSASTIFITDCEYNDDLVTGEFQATSGSKTVLDGMSSQVNLKAGVAKTYPYTPNLNK